MKLFGMFLALIVAAEIVALTALRTMVPDTPILALISIPLLTLFIAFVARRWMSSAAFGASRVPWM